MAKNSITDYDNTAANNTDVQSVDISEGCSPSGINNAIREVMADLADVNEGTIALESPKFDSIKDGNIKPPDASGTDVAGTATTIKGGAGTGTGAGGSIIFQTADGGSTGSSVNAHATAMTITDDGSIDINGNELILDADGDSKIEASTDDTINIISGGTTGLTVDSSGRVLTPVRPAFFARNTASIFRTVAETVKYNDVSSTGCFNDGGHYSTTTYKFTAPVNGLYSFAAQFYSNNEATSVMYFMIDTSPVAGSQVNGINDQSAYEGIEMAVTLKLTANQTVYIMSATGGYHLNNNLSYFCGHLIG